VHGKKRQLLSVSKETEMIRAAVERCAGIDVGKTKLAVCVMVGPLNAEPRAEVRQFLTLRSELEKLRQWLREEQVTHVAMESTGSYWKPVFNVLEDQFQVCLANPVEVRNRKGHKTDNKDGQWLAHLLRHAMITPSFIPPRALRELRDLTRRRKRLLSQANSERNRVQKVLEDANIKLGNVLSDMFGVSGQLMLEALLKGETEVGKIAALGRGKLQRKVAEVEAALEGHQMNEHHRRMIRFSLEHLQFLENQIAALDREIEQQIERAGLSRQWEALRSIPGIQQTSAATILAETGSDMSAFENEKKFSSWAGVCPGNNRSAGKNRSSKTTGGNPWLRGALTECAWAAASRKDCFLKEKFRRIAARSGGKKKAALVAISHTLLLLVYRVLETGIPYTPRQAAPLTPDQQNRLIRHHIRRLGKLGITVCSCRSTSTSPPRKASNEV
jgi:transposase